MRRRDFIKVAACGTCACTMAGMGLPRAHRKAAAGESNPPRSPQAAPTRSLREAMYYHKREHKEIECVLCPRKCVVGDRERGYCGVRENQDGIYYTLVYNQACSCHTDPIEKKPFFHFHPGSLAFSLSTAGCNMNCKYCQNWETSQVRPEQVRNFDLTPADCTARASEDKALSIAYTYTEPVIFIEYMREIAVAARQSKLKNLMVSAGFVEQQPLGELLPLLDAVKIDLKSFSDAFYRDVCRGRLEPVLETLKTIRRQGVWLEIVYLVLPTLNDSPKEIQALCHWLVSELGPEVPVHFTRFHPIYLMKNLPPTPVDTLERIRETALAEGLHFPYVGNVPGHPGESTYCPQCRKRLIQRLGYNLRIEALDKGRCLHCGKAIAGCWA